MIRKKVKPLFPNVKEDRPLYIYLRTDKELNPGSPVFYEMNGKRKAIGRVVRQTRGNLSTGSIHGPKYLMVKVIMNV